MIKVLIAILLAGSIVAIDGVAHADGAWDSIWRSERALERTSMVGEVRTMTFDGSRNISATAAVSAGQGKIRLDYNLGGRSWTIIDDGRQLIHLLPQMRVAEIHDRPTLAVDRTLAERNYQTRRVGLSRVAQREVETIELVHREGGPPTLRLSLDARTGFALKRERYTVEGRLISSTEYLEVDYGANVSPEIFRIPEGFRTVRLADLGRRLRVDELNRLFGFAVREPTYLPPGYVLLGGYERKLGQWEQRTAELRYTDGLRVLSVHQRERGSGGLGPPGGRGGRGRGFGGPPRSGARAGPPVDAPSDPPRRGRFGRFGREDMTLVDRGSEKTLRYFGRDRVVLVIGDLPGDELIRIAKSID